MPPTALVLQPDADAGPGHVADWLTARGYAIDLRRPSDGLPGTHEADLVVALGSDHGAWQDDPPWIPAQAAYLAEALARDVPVLGICFGGQSLARAAGGAVTPNAATEIGMVDVRSDVAALRGPWFAWHRDTFTPPADAAVLAVNDVTVQAFRVGRSVGVQFHPEVTTQIVTDWFDLATSYTGDPQPVIDAVRQDERRLAAACHALMDWWADDVARLTPHR